MMNKRDRLRWQLLIVDSVTTGAFYYSKEIIMPKSTRNRPTEITIKVRCCQRGCTVTTRGDWKHKTCWHCGNLIYFHRHPRPYVEINDVEISADQWHVVAEIEVDEEE